MSEAAMITLLKLMHNMHLKDRFVTAYMRHMIYPLAQVRQRELSFGQTKVSDEVVIAKHSISFCLPSSWKWCVWSMPNILIWIQFGLYCTLYLKCYTLGTESIRITQNGKTHWHGHVVSVFILERISHSLDALQNVEVAHIGSLSLLF